MFSSLLNMPRVKACPDFDSHFCAIEKLFYYLYFQGLKCTRHGVEKYFDGIVDMRHGTSYYGGLRAMANFGHDEDEDVRKVEVIRLSCQVWSLIYHKQA